MFATSYHFAVTGMLVGWLATAGLAEDPSPSPPSDRQAHADRLLIEQAKVADTYARFEKNLTDLANFLRETDPARAAVMEKAVELMNREDTTGEFQELIRALSRDSLLIREVDEAIDKQQEVQEQLATLLTLLLTENREKTNHSQKQRIRKYIKQLNRVQTAPQERAKIPNESTAWVRA